jgi:DNA polymerase III sliding clamp (beta) subunit (PCNA family)
MLLQRKALEIVRAASKDQTRQSICGIRIEADGATIATDGHILAKFTPTANPDGKEYPAIEGVSADDGESRLQPFTLPSEAVAILLKALPKKAPRCLPILGHVALDVQQTNTNGCAVAAITDLENPQVFKLRKVADDFPTYQSVFPKGKPKFVIGFMMAALENLISTLRVTGVEAFVVEVRDETGPALIKARTKDGDGLVTALIMPARVDNPEPWQEERKPTE